MIIPVMLFFVGVSIAVTDKNCEDARSNAIQAVEAAWMQEPSPTVSTSTFTLTPCSCGDCTSNAIYYFNGNAPLPSSAYYECKMQEAKRREEAQRKQQEAEQKQADLVDKAKEAMYKVRDVCGEGPKRPASPSVQSEGHLLLDYGSVTEKK